VARPLPAGENYVTLGFRQLWRTLKQVRRYRELFKLLLAFVVYNDGIVTVITFAALYAEQTIGFTPAEIVTMFILMNVVALVGAGTFGWLADSDWSEADILISLGLWILAIVAAYFAQTKTAFYAVAVLAGIGMGSCQSVTRSLVAVFTPKPNAAEFAGFPWVRGQSGGFSRSLVVRDHLTSDRQPASGHSVGGPFLRGGHAVAPDGGRGEGQGRQPSAGRGGLTRMLPAVPT
jgi:MFS-type transporter involved in bile tolerance (Atg22 family)